MQDRDVHESDHQPSPSSGSHSSHGAGISSDNQDGTLLLSEEGQSQFVSSLHYALLADEVSQTPTLPPGSYQITCPYPWIIVPKLACIPKACVTYSHLGSLGP
jgi:hypothetical protein